MPGLRHSLYSLLLYFWCNHFLPFHVALFKTFAVYAIFFCSMYCSIWCYSALMYSILCDPDIIYVWMSIHISVHIFYLYMHLSVHLSLRVRRTHPVEFLTICKEEILRGHEYQPMWPNCAGKVRKIGLRVNLDERRGFMTQSLGIFYIQPRRK